MDYQNSQPPDPFAEPPPSNGLGTVGLWVGVLQLFTCGILSPIGLLCSLIALRKEPRTNAWIGLVLNGVVGISLLSTVVMMGAIGGAGFFISKATAEFAQTRQELNQARNVILSQARSDKALPDTEAGTALLEEYMSDASPMKYELDGKNYTITSAGPDGKFDTIDDGEVSGAQLPNGSFIITDKLQPGGRRPPLE